MRTDAALRRAIARADAILPGRPVADGKRDPRWQAIIRVGEFIDAHPDEVWAFALRWGKHPQADLRMAVATCLLEHLLEAHFDRVFPLVRRAARESRRFAQTFASCWWFGDAALPENAARVERLKRELHRQPRGR